MMKRDNMWINIVLCIGLYFNVGLLNATDKEYNDLRNKGVVEQQMPKDMTEALHALFVLRGKIDNLSNQYEKQTQQVLSALQAQGKEVSSEFCNALASLAYHIEQDKQLHETYLREIENLYMLTTHQMRDMLPSYYNDTMRQCEQINEAFDNLEIVLTNQLASLCISLTQLINNLKTCMIEGFADNQKAIIEISNIIISELSAIAKIYTDQVLIAIGIVDEHVQKSEEALFNEIGSATTYLSTQLDMTQQTLDSQIVSQSNAILSQIEFTARQQQELALQIQAAVSRETSLTAEQTSFLYEQLQRIQQSMEDVQHTMLSAFSCNQTEQTNDIKAQLIEVQAALQSFINQTSGITNQEITYCCKELCLTIHELYAQLDSQMQRLASDAEVRSIEQTNKLASKLSAIDSHLYVSTNYLLQKINEVDDDVLNQASLIQAQLACIEAEVSNELIQKVSDLSTEQVVNTNNIISQIAQTRTLLSNEVALKISYAQLQLVEQNNELYSKICEVDSSIARNVSHGVIDVKKQIALEGLAVSSQLEVVETEIVDGLTRLVSDGFTDLTTQNDALCSKLAQAQADLNQISGEIEDHDCNMTEQHASICSKISAVEAKIVQEIANTNLHLSWTGYRIVQEVAHFATEVGVLVRRATSSLNTGITYLIDLITEGIWIDVIPIV